MTFAKQAPIKIKQAAAKTAQSKAQKLFNTLIGKIAAQKAALQDWQAFIPDYNRIVSSEYEQVRDSYNQKRLEIVMILDQAYQNKLFKKLDKQKISHIVVEITADLLEHDDNPEIKSLNDKYSDVDFDEMLQESDEFAAQVLKNMAQDMYGVDLGDELDASSPEKIRETLEKLQAEAEQGGAHTAKPSKQKARQEKEQQNLKLSIRDIYRKLSSVLHPDREQDEQERERKTVIMQRVNAAYAKKDLLGLLELQIEVAQIDQHHLNNIGEDKLKSFNKILKQQLAELEQEVEQISVPFKMQLQLPPYAGLTPQQLLQYLRRDIAQLQRDVRTLTKDISVFQDPNHLKRWLKTYRIPVQPEIDDLFMDDLFRENW